VHATVPDVEPGHGDAALERDAIGLRLPRQRGGEPNAFGDPVSRHEIRA
jgi:hypothetical protein